MDNDNKQKVQEKKEADLEKLLKQNLAVSQEILNISRYIKKYIFWSRIISVVKILIILVPIILGIMYLPPIIERAVDNINNNINNPLTNITNFK
ncbi:MAG TPA: hypothetical protein VJ926_00515 [Patescibacteria group bacterium]|nr:hypothetical protein [Patescibacteria group bacterium]